MIAKTFFVALLLAGLSRAREVPNIVLIMADDLGVECLGAYGGSTYATPRLDALADWIERWYPDTPA